MGLIWLCDNVESEEQQPLRDPARCVRPFIHLVPVHLTAPRERYPNLPAKNHSQDTSADLPLSAWLVQCDIMVA